MIRFAFWPNDGRGPVLVMSLDSRDELENLLAAVDSIDASQKSMSISDLELVQIIGFSSVAFEAAAATRLIFEQDRLVIQLSTKQIDEFKEKIKLVILNNKACHSFICLAGGIDLVLSTGEYGPEHFASSL